MALALALDKLSILLYHRHMEKTNTLEYQRDEHRVHLIVYHLIWCPRRRKAILVGKIRERLQQLIEEQCKEKGWVILTLAIQPDHVHLFVRVWPSDSASDVVKDIKGLSSRRLGQEFASVFNKLPSVWTRSYFSSTAGAVSAQTIKQYIDAQKGV